MGTPKIFGKNRRAATRFSKETIRKRINGGPRRSCHFHPAGPTHPECRIPGGALVQRGSVFTVVVVVVEAAGRETVVVVLRTGFFTTLRVVVRDEE